MKWQFFLPEYLNMTMHVWPNITQAMLRDRRPWIVGMVSAPTE